ncbi:MAG TPA: hypothetical protein VG711_02635 [Phycisphaerales bacterium]|nr:hypothetical protein [Phycisphaerales bacterium]
MHKFLNKYKKWIMAIGSVILLVTFLAPAGFNELTQRFGANNAVVAYMGDATIKAKEWSEVQEDVRALESLAANNFLSLSFFDNQKASLAQWYLLYHQAQQFNFENPSVLSTETLNNLASHLQQDPRVIDRVFAKYTSIARMVSGFSSAVHLSDERLKAFAQRQYLTADVEALVVQAVPRDDAPFPSEQEITDQFKKFADVKPGEGEHGFGYRFPNRAKLEWLTFSADDVKKQLQDSPEFSPTEQRKYWEKHVEDRHLPALPAPGVYTPVPQAVKDSFLESLVDERLDEIAKFAVDRLRLSRRGLKESAGIVTLPDDWDARRLAFPDLAQAVQDQFHVLPAYNSTGAEWLDVEKVRDLAGVGPAQTNKFGKTAMDLGALVSVAHEFDPESVVPIQKGIEGPVLSDHAGNRYIFRILDTSPAHAPTDASEVRIQVIKDLRKIMDYKSLVDQIPELERRAREEGLLNMGLQRGVAIARPHVFLQNADMVIRFYSQIPNLDFSTALPEPIGQDKATIGAIIDHVLAIPDITQGTVDVSSLPAEQTAFIIPVEDKLSLIMVHLTGVKPLTEDQYAKLVDLGAAQTAFRRTVLNAQDAFKDTFSLDALTKRYNFRMAKNESEDSDSKTPSTHTNANPSEAPKL